MPGAELIILKEERVLTEYRTEPHREVVNVLIGLGWFKAARRMWWENFSMPTLIRAHSPDVYLTFSHYLPMVDIKIPSVVGVSNLAPFSKEAWSHESTLVKLKMAALRRTIVSSSKRASCVLALSETCKEVLIANGVAPAHIVVTSNGVDSHWGDVLTSKSVLERLGIDRPFLLYVSHFHRYKNHARLVEAYARLSPDVRDTHQLVLVGKPHSQSCFDEIGKLIERLGLTSNVVVIPGEGSDSLRELYQKAALFIFPSLIENSPNILLEAMMAGAPIATSRLSPMPEFCGSAAMYFDALNVQDMAGTISRMLEQPSLLTDLRLRARNQAGKFSWDQFVRSMAQHLDMAIRLNAGISAG